MYNILFLLSTDFLSGAEKAVRDIAIHINKNIFAPVFICTGECLAKVFRQHDFKTYVVNDFRGRFNAFWPDINICKIIQGENIKLIHAVDVNASIKAYMVSRKFGVPVISHIQNTYDWLKRFSLRRMLDIFFRNKYSISIACSKHTLNYYLMNNILAKPDKIMCIPNAIDFDEIPTEFNKTIPDNHIKLLFVGRLHRQKRLDLMLRSLRTLLSVEPRVRLYVVGHGEDRERLEKFKDTLGLTDYVSFLGRKENVYDYYNDADIFLMSSDYEGLPMALLEAMAMKNVVISTDVGGVSELVRDGETGFLVKKGDAKALAEKLIEVVNNIDYYKRTVGQRAYNWAFENYNIADYVRRMEDIYRELIKNSP